MTDPRPNNEPRPRVEPQESPAPVPAAVLSMVAFAIGVAWLVLFVIRIAHGGAANRLDTWFPLVSGLAFLLLGGDRLRRALRTPR